MSQQWSLNYYKNSSVGSRNKTQISCYLSSRSVLLHITFSCFIISVYAFNIDCSITVICILHPFYSYFLFFFPVLVWVYQSQQTQSVFLSSFLQMSANLCKSRSPALGYIWKCHCPFCRKVADIAFLKISGFFLLRNSA